MSSVVLIQFGGPLVAAFAGGAVGWWLRGRPGGKAEKRPELPQKQLAAQVLQNLQMAAETVRACVEQHTDCIRTIQSELDAPTSTEPVVITKLAESIIESNLLAQHQCNDIRQALSGKRQEIRDCLANADRLLFTFASLDRQKQAYSQVLSSLEVLAAELSNEIKGHGQRLSKISGSLENAPNNTASGIASAVTQILDATAGVQRHVARVEQRIAAHAENLEMQAILTHADLLTSLPNRRALVDELQRAAAQRGHMPLATLLFVDLDSFSLVNSKYGHQGGDVILRQAAAAIKTLARGRDMVARFCGDTFALLLNQTTLHDALPIAERIRKQLQETQFSQGTHSLHVTASIGIAQMRPEEMRDATMDRAEQALLAAKQAGGNVCYRHDGEKCFPVSSVFQPATERATGESLSLAALWSGAAGESNGAASEQSAPAAESDPNLSGRSLFAANLGRRLAEWKRGGASVSVAVLRVDQMDELVGRFGDQGQSFLRHVLGRLLEAATRDMDDRCEFEDGLFALLLPSTDETSALAVADRLCSQVRQCKVRMGRDLWDLTASIGVAHCTVATRVMDIMLSAEAALHAAVESGGDRICIGQAIHEAQAATIV
jgi:diguanylate cyclase (GGDEF)-like protein